MMMFKKTVTALAVDSARSYLQERLNELKQLDLDKDGKKDVDQCSEILVELGEKVKEALESTDFQKLGTGLEQVISGVGQISDSVDRQKLAAACDHLGTGLHRLGKLLRVGIAEMKEQK